MVTPVILMLILYKKLVIFVGNHDNMVLNRHFYYTVYSTASIMDIRLILYGKLLIINYVACHFMMSGTSIWSHFTWPLFKPCPMMYCLLTNSSLPAAVWY